MAELGVRNLNGYNKKVLESIKTNNPIQDPTWKPDEKQESEEVPYLEELPAPGTDYNVIEDEQYLKDMKERGEEIVKW